MPTPKRKVVQVLVKGLRTKKPPPIQTSQRYMIQRRHCSPSHIGVCVSANSPVTSALHAERPSRLPPTHPHIHQLLQTAQNSICPPWGGGGTDVGALLMTVYQREPACGKLKGYYQTLIPHQALLLTSLGLARL